MVNTAATTSRKRKAELEPIKRELTATPTPEPDQTTKGAHDSSAVDSPEPEPEVKPAKKRKPKSDQTTRKWTPEEQLALLDVVVGAAKPGHKLFSDFQGRTPNQAYLAWKQSVEPYLKKALRDRK